MHQWDHEKHCIEVLGIAYKLIHEFLDQYYLQFRSVFHRCALHHRQGIELTVKMFAEKYGEEGARAAAELHIMDDFGRIPADWTDMDECWFPLGDEEKEMHDILVNLYGAEAVK